MNSMEGESKDRSSKSEQHHVDPFVATMPTNLSLEDCIIDKAEHKTIGEQRAFYAKKMQEMARVGHDEEDGWTLFGKTDSHLEPIEIHQRTVDWSPTKQYRSVAETAVDVEFLFRDICDGIYRPVIAADSAKRMSRVTAETDFQQLSKNFHYIFLKRGEDWVTGLQCKSRAGEMET